MERFLVRLESIDNRELRMRAEEKEIPHATFARELILEGLYPDPTGPAPSKKVEKTEIDFSNLENFLGELVGPAKLMKLKSIAKNRKMDLGKLVAALIDEEYVRSRWSWSK